MSLSKTDKESLFERVQRKYDENPEAFSDLNGTYQLDMSADGGAKLVLLVLDGLFDLHEGELPQPDYTLSVSSQHLNMILSGSMNPITAYMSGKLRLSGKPDMFDKIRRLLG